MLAKPFRTGISLGICIASLALASSAAAQDPIETPKSPKQTGFAIQTSLITTTTGFDTDQVNFSLASTEGGITFGYKDNRVMLGVGFDFTNLSKTSVNEIYDPTTGQVTGTEEVTGNAYTFVVYPELQVALAQSADKRAELLGDLSVGFGTWGSYSSNDLTPSTTETDLRVRWRVGPGVRYWVHPQIAMSLVTGISGNHMFTFGDRNSTDRSTGVTTLFTQIGLMGVF